MRLNWVFKKFEELTNEELYAIMRLRNEVFVIEQNCIYQDADNKDQKSFHFCGWDEENLLAYTRIIPPGVSYEEASIGRVVTSPAYRGSGKGRELMERSIEACFSQFSTTTIRIGAQLYLKNFYESLGFIQTGEEYLEDGIPHIEMLLIK